MFLQMAEEVAEVEVVLLQPLSANFPQTKAKNDYCGEVGYYSLDNGNSITVETPALPSNEDYNFTFVYRVGSPGQIQEDIFIEIGGETFNFADFELNNAEEFVTSDPLTASLDEGVNTFKIGGSGINSVHIEAFRIFKGTIEAQEEGPSLPRRIFRER